MSKVLVYLDAFRLRNPILRGPATALRKSIVDFHCMVERDRDDDRNLFYELYKVNDTQSKGMFSTLDNDQPEAKFPVWIKPTHEGYYYCKASVQNRSEVMPTYSSHHYLAVIGKYKNSVWSEIFHIAQISESLIWCDFK